MKRILVSLIAILMFVSLNESPVSGQDSSTRTPDLQLEARRAIDKGNAQWIEAWEKGDPSMVAALFTEDGSILSSNGKVIKGRKQILEKQKAGMDYVGRGVRVTVTTTDMWLDGETAYETGKYVYNYRLKGKPVTDEGRYVTIWKREKDGSWKLFMDMIVP